MTAAFTKPQAIVAPFCSDGDKSALPLTSGIVASQELGWPVVQSTPLPPDGAGLPVNRLQSNGILNLYTQFTLWNSVGGQWTFDADIIPAGGYNNGAVLYDAGSQSYQVSLIDNNVANFLTTRSYLNDRLHWMQITNPVQTGFNFKVDPVDTPYIITQIDGLKRFSNYVDDASFELTCSDPAISEFPIGFSFEVIFNRGGTLNFIDGSGTFAVVFPDGSDKVHTVSADGTSWFVDASPARNYQPTIVNGDGNSINYIIKTGTFDDSGGFPVDVSFAQSFPNACLGVIFQTQTDITVYGGSSNEIPGSKNVTADGFQAVGGADPNPDTANFFYLAIGY